MREKELERLKDYKYGFSTDIENFKAPKGLNEEVIKFISKIKKEPQWLLEWRLKAFERLKVLKEPNWQKPKILKLIIRIYIIIQHQKVLKKNQKVLMN
tara:strand:- start:152 stop:445 length:294 start_codon:yes stop_codon:yes gene_type:complete